MKKIIGGSKDENGIFTKDKEVLPPIITVKEPLVTDISIDELLQRCLRSIHGLMRAIEVDIGSGDPSRDTVMNLKDVSNLLWDFKKKEQEFLEGISEEDLEKMTKK